MQRLFPPAKQIINTVYCLYRRSLGTKTVKVCHGKLTEIISSDTRGDIEEHADAANYIVAHVLGEKTLHCVDKHAPVSDMQWMKMKKFGDEYLQGKPVQYVLGEWDFMDFNIKVKPPVLIPRPRTEELVNLIQSDRNTETAKAFLEVGCGSGCISIALLRYMPQLFGVAVDKSAVACNLTEENANSFNLTERLKVYNKRLSKDTISEFSPLHTEKFDFIVSNPPYIPSREMESLPPEVRDYEDHGALDGGPDGLDIVCDVLELARTVLKPRGSLWLEVHKGQPAMIMKALEKDKILTCVGIYKDIQNIESLVCIKA